MSPLLLLLLLLLPGLYNAYRFGPTYIDWSTFTCNDLNERNTDQMEGCSFRVASGDHQEVICKLIAKQGDTSVAVYRKVLLLTLNFRLMGNMSDQEENVYCASVASMQMEIRNDSISEVHTVGDLPEAFISFLYFVADDTYIVLEFTKKIPLAIVAVNPECHDDATKMTEGARCVKSVRFMKEIKRGAFYLQFPSDAFWNFLKQRFIAELGAEMTRLKLTSSGQLSGISLHFFKRLMTSDLHMKELTLVGLKVGHLTDSVVTMPTLEILRLPDNGITTISEAALPEVPNIQQLDVAGNELEELPAWLPDGLVFLNVSRNRLATLPSELPQKLSNLNISYNAIEVLQETLPATLRVLDASHNALRKLPQKLPQDLYLLDVSHNRLQMLHKDLPSMLQVLKVSYNHLRTVDPQLLVSRQHLQLLDVSHNSLTAVDGLWLSHKLTVLNISNNILHHIRLLGPGSVSHVDASQNAIQSWQVNTERLTLVGNPRAPLGLHLNNAQSRVAVVDLGEGMQLNCDPCSAQSAVALRLRRWLINQQNNGSLEGPRVERPKQPLCTDPQEQAGVELAQASGLEDTSHCPGSLRHVSQYVLLAIVVMALVVGAAVFCHYRRYEITYIIHLMKMRRERRAAERRDPSSYKYDAFVCYSSSDRAWVVGQLLQKLESAGDSPDEPALRLCLHERDFPLGSFITENIMSSMRDSRSTVVILSQAFVDSQWCCWELELASSKVSHLVLVELTRLERGRLPRHLRYLMDTRTYLEWPQQPKQEGAMWRRLRATLAIPAPATNLDEAEEALPDDYQKFSSSDVKA